MCLKLSGSNGIQDCAKRCGEINKECKPKIAKAGQGKRDKNSLNHKTDNYVLNRYIRTAFSRINGENNGVQTISLNCNIGYFITGSVDGIKIGIRRLLSRMTIQI